MLSQPSERSGPLNGQGPNCIGCTKVPTRSACSECGADCGHAFCPRCADHIHEKPAQAGTNARVEAKTADARRTGSDKRADAREFAKKTALATAEQAGYLAAKGAAAGGKAALRGVARAAFGSPDEREQSRASWNLEKARERQLKERGIRGEPRHDYARAWQFAGGGALVSVAKCRHGFLVLTTEAMLFPAPRVRKGQKITFPPVPGRQAGGSVRWWPVARLLEISVDGPMVRLGAHVLITIFARLAQELLNARSRTTAECLNASPQS